MENRVKVKIVWPVCRIPVFDLHTTMDRGYQWSLTLGYSSVHWEHWHGSCETAMIPYIGYSCLNSFFFAMYADVGFSLSIYLELWGARSCFTHPHPSPCSCFNYLLQGAITPASTDLSIPFPCFSLLQLTSLTSRIQLPTHFPFFHAFLF